MTKPTGQCFPWVLENCSGDDVVVHGRVWHQPTKKRFWHAWIERNGRVYDWQRSEMREPWYDMEGFYRITKPTHVKKYPWRKARKIAKTWCVEFPRVQPFGPWHVKSVR